MATATFTVSKQYMAALTGQANPGDSHIPLGLWDPGTGLTWVTRALLYAPVSFSGMTAITAARLYFYQHTAAGWHANGSGTATLTPYRKTSDWSETSGGVSASVDELWGGDGDSYVEGGYVHAGDAASSFNADAADGTLDYVDITDIVVDWFGGSANYGVMVKATSESSSYDALEMYSRHVTGKKPYIWVEYDTNTAPNAPTSLSPTANAIRHTGNQVICSGTRSDPNSGDYITAYQILLYKDDGTTLLQDSGKINVSGSPTTFSRTMSIGSQPTNTFYKWKARTWDKAAVAGPYSALQRFKANTVPSAPTGMSQSVDTLVPLFSAIYTDADRNYGDVRGGIGLEVYDLSGAPKWIYEDNSLGNFTIQKTYAGTALAYGTTYKWRCRAKDNNGAWSAWSAYVQWTPGQPAGPTISPRNTVAGDPAGGKINDTTPDLTLTYASNFLNHDIYIYTDASRANLVWHPTIGSDYAGTLSKVVAVVGALTNGTTYYWTASVKTSAVGSDSRGGTWTQWTNGWTGSTPSGPALTTKFYINALPTAPTNLKAVTVDGGIPVLRDSDGTMLVTTTTPVLTFQYNDPDYETYDDVPSNGDIEVYNDGTGALHWSSTNQSGLNDGHLLYAGTALVMETTYKFRVRFKDTSGTYGAWSAYAKFKVTQPSSVATVTPTGTLTNPAITFTWNHTSPSGKAQGKYRVQVYDKGPTGLPSYQEAVLALNPLIYVRMGGPTLTNVGSGSMGAITPTNGPVLESPGLLTRDEDTAVLFDGVNDWISLASVPIISTAITIACWGSTSLDLQEYFAHRGSTGYMRRTTSNRLTFGWNDTSPASRTLTSPVDTLMADGLPHFCVATHDGTTARLYVDGLEVANVGTWNFGSITLGTWGIGSTSTGSGDYFNGTLDEFALWSGTALSPTQIADLYTSGTDPQNYPSPIRVYDSGYVTSSVESHTAAGFLVNTHDYRVDVESIDTDGV